MLFFFCQKSCRFLKIEKKCLYLGKKCPDCVQLWINFSIQNVVLSLSRSKNFRLFLSFLTKDLWKCSNSTESSRSCKISGYAPDIELPENNEEK